MLFVSSIGLKYATTILFVFYFEKCSDALIRDTNPVQVFLDPNIPLLVDGFVKVIDPVSNLAFPGDKIYFEFFLNYKIF